MRQQVLPPIDFTIPTIEDQIDMLDLVLELTYLE